jgi:hypothetical protein
MAQYRMYFVENSGRFRWPYDVSASCDRDAVSIAHAAQYACSDLPVSVELWDGARKVPGAPNRTSRVSRELWDSVSSSQPEVLLRLTEALRSSGTAVARSRRLSQEFDALKSRQSAPAARQG